MIRSVTLFDLVRDLRRKQTVGLTEGLAKSYSFQLASALRYLHEDVKIAHRGIKLEAVLLDNTRGATGMEEYHLIKL
jgi:serine/threonine protein kinase